MNSNNLPTLTVDTVDRVLDARPDTLDFRDKMFVPTLVEVPTTIDLADYTDHGCPILDQGKEGACTDFALAAVVNYLQQSRDPQPTPDTASARMLYETAKRYDEWPGQNYSGSSARGAMKGWHKHGVCSDALWPYTPGSTDTRLTRDRGRDATQRPLGAYFRVNHRDVVAMHAAIAETGILYATATVHRGWSRIRRDGTIPFYDGSTGGHAFAIVAYDADGLWIQNSWGQDWGKGGFARVSYDDWLLNGSDVWVARLGAPINLGLNQAVAVYQNTHSENPGHLASWELRPHVVSTGNDGQLHAGGMYGTDEGDLDEIVNKHIPLITESWSRKRLLLYAHGGLTGEKSAVQRLAENRTFLLANEVYPVSFIWRSDFWSTLRNILSDAIRRRRPEGFLDGTMDFLMDRVDALLEPVARTLGGKAQWDEMKENARLATESRSGGAVLFLDRLVKLVESDPSWEIHLAGHSAGSIFLGPLATLLATNGQIGSGTLKGRNGLGLGVSSLTLWAPACTMDFFDAYYLSAIESGSIDRFALYNLSDDAERDDHCAQIYNKSLLYLVSNAFEQRLRSPFASDGEPLLGLDKFVKDHGRLKVLFRTKRKHCRYVVSPGSPNAGSTTHGGFDNDGPTRVSTLKRILDGRKPKLDSEIAMSTRTVSERRRMLGGL